MKDAVLQYLSTETFQLWTETWSVLITILLELAHPATVNAMRMHLHSKLFDHYFILNGRDTITALQTLPFFFLSKNSLFSMRLIMTLPYFVDIFFSSWKVVFSVTAKNSINLHWAFSYKGVITTRVSYWYLPALINPISNIILARKVFSFWYMEFTSQKDFSFFLNFKI